MTAESNASAWYETIVECVKDLDRDGSVTTDEPLSLQVRSGWQSVGEKLKAAEFEILLTTGGPGLRLVGELDCDCTPTSAVLELQDWFTPWTPYKDADPKVLLRYAQSFYFGAR